jgi:hypothetical protein
MAGGGWQRKTAIVFFRDGDEHRGMTASAECSKLRHAQCHPSNIREIRPTRRFCRAVLKGSIRPMHALVVAVWLPPPPPFPSPSPLPPRLRLTIARGQRGTGSGGAGGHFPPRRHPRDAGVRGPLRTAHSARRLDGRSHGPRDSGATVARIAPMPRPGVGSRPELVDDDNVGARPSLPFLLAQR